MTPPDPGASAAPRRAYQKAVGPRLAILLRIVFGLFAILACNGVYLVSITALEWYRGETYQDYFYQLMFLVHLVLGVLWAVPYVVFGVLHWRATANRSNRTAIAVGKSLFFAGLSLIVSGVVLTRLEGFEIRDPTTRQVAYWVHVISPLACTWLFILHRLAGPRIRWRVGGAWAAVASVFVVAMVVLQSQDPRAWNQVGPDSGEQYFFPSLARTATGDFIPAESLDNNTYCQECHPDVHEQWSESMHRFSSFNNPVYLASVAETRQVTFERDGSVQASRFCAGCHDPVPFFSGAFDDPDFDMADHPTAHAGVTCTACHAITHVNSPRGNADYTIEEPLQYPFAFSESPALRWVNRQLILAKPAFHKKTFLKPLHRSEEFCGTCHKVHLPVELNGYKWLRGQNHYDSFVLSGVSGHGASSFYYPPTSEADCNGCHLPLVASDDFGARDFDDSGVLSVHDHQFASANTAILQMLDRPQWAMDQQKAFNEGVMRIDLFGLRRGGTIEGELLAPLRPELPTLEPGQRYLLETVVRTMKMGHLFTQGTVDSNEIWVEIILRQGDQVLGVTGGRDEAGRVDPWSHFVNAYVIDRDGNRISRRNAQDIFVALYNHQIPPGAADVVHGAFEVPADVRGPITLEARLLYRKFDSDLLAFVQGDDFAGNDLPVLELARDELTLPVAGGASAGAGGVEPTVPEWMRWNDYGIALLRKGESGANKGELRQAEEAFAEVEVLGRPDGPLNRARVYVKEGRVDEAVAALNRAAEHDPPAPPWTVAWFTGVVNLQNGYLDEAIQSFRDVLTMDTAETRERGFDFSRDYRVWNQLGQALFERAQQERGEARAASRRALLEEALAAYEEALTVDPENVSAHYGLSQVHADLGDADAAAAHRRLHGTYRPDDNARDRAVTEARLRDPAANHAAEAVVIYDLQRPGRFPPGDRSHDL